MLRAWMRRFLGIDALCTNERFDTLSGYHAAVRRAIVSVNEELDMSHGGEDIKSKSLRLEEIESSISAEPKLRLLSDEALALRIDAIAKRQSNVESHLERIGLSVDVMPPTSFESLHFKCDGLGKRLTTLESAVTLLGKQAKPPKKPPCAVKKRGR
jgi:hypothetical protein